MEKILFLLGAYKPMMSANGACVDEIINGLNEKEYEVHVVCAGEKYDFSPFDDSPNIYTIKSDNVMQIREKEGYTENVILSHFKKAIRKVKIALLLPLFPIQSPSRIISYYRMCRKLDRQHNFDCIISVLQPIESVIAGYMMKKINPKKRFFIYQLDSLTNDSNKYRSVIRHLSYLTTMWERKIFKKADYIFYMKCHESHYSKQQYQPFFHKMCILDIPLLSRKTADEIDAYNEKNESDRILMLYGGALLKQVRTPEYAIEVIQALSKNIPLQCSFFTRGSYEQYLMDLEKETNGVIKACGYVTQKELNSSIAATDFLISIGNDVTEMIPSKIFVYMSTGKPIIHIYSQNDDTCIRYLEKYPLVLLLNQNDSLQNNVESMQRFILTNRGKKADFDIIENVLIENTPGYSTASIIQKLQQGV